ncbi:hypothetical protein [Fictibacillus enclensis]|uniref:hypothetical protein n=1 Tax=Fictibacillus enclensis TaxID=1017270 RepID=UPI003CD0CCE3
MMPYPYPPYPGPMPFPAAPGGMPGAMPGGMPGAMPGGMTGAGAGYPGMPGGSYYTPYNNPLKLSTMTSVEWFVQRGLAEAPKTSYEHALRETAAMAYLYGMGYPQQAAYKLVESWELGEKFYPGER